jgi:hypothetical protein
MIGYLVTFALGYGAARVIDNPDRARAAARAVAGEGRRIGSSIRRASGKEEPPAGRLSGRQRRALRKGAR